METAGERTYSRRDSRSGGGRSQEYDYDEYDDTRMRAVTIPMTTLMTVPMTEAGTGELEETEVLTVCQPQEAALPGKKSQKTEERL